MTRLGKLGKDKIESKNNYTNKIVQKKIDELRTMKLHGQRGIETDDKKSEKSWHWLRNGSLKREI